MGSSHNFQGLYTNVHIANGCLNNQWKRGGTEGYGQSSGAGGECSYNSSFSYFIMRGNWKGLPFTGNVNLHFQGNFY